ncbi:MAG: CoA ester lyase [Nitrososphaerota archaeon]|nr:CoA ester lyase [Nitrososphaerota archaeon]
MLRRSQLFVPANDEKKIRKSATLSSDSIIFDLEDAVPETEKAKARVLLSSLLDILDWGDCELCVRINKVGFGYSEEDLSFAARHAKLDSIVLPKVENIPYDLAKSCGKSLVPLVETAKGLLSLEKTVRLDGVTAVGYGPADFALSLGGRTAAYSRNLFVKTQIVVTASAYGVDAIDSVFFDLSDLEGFRSEAIESRDLGFVGKQVVHPSQIPIANQTYSPTGEEIAEARKVVVAYEKSVQQNAGALRLDEKLVDAVHYRKAKQLIEKTHNP